MNSLNSDLRSEDILRSARRYCLLFASAGFAWMLAATPAMAQGQDSTPTERDVLVLAELLDARLRQLQPGVFRPASSAIRKTNAMTASSFAIDRVGGPDSMLLAFREFCRRRLFARSLAPGALALSPDNERGGFAHGGLEPPSGRPGSDGLKAQASAERPEAPPDCVVYWTREAAQFRGQGGRRVRRLGKTKSMLGEQQLWLDAPGRP